MSDNTCPQIVFYHYAYSTFARRIQWYLLLRGLPYSECVSLWTRLLRNTSFLFVADTIFLL